MQRVQAEAIRDGTVLVQGKWLRCLGNISVSLGDMVWTDGRCVYGQVAEGSSGAYIITGTGEAGIPILQSEFGFDYAVYYFYGQNGLTKIGTGAKKEKLINNSDMYNFVSSNVLDAAYDSEGNLYTLEYGSANYEFDTGSITMSGGLVKCNGEVIGQYDLTAFLLSAINEVRSKAESRTIPMTEGEWPDSQTSVKTSYCSTLAGKIDAHGAYTLVVQLSTEVEHDEFSYDNSRFSSDYYEVVGNVATSSKSERFLYDGSEVTEWFHALQTSWRKYRDDTTSAYDSGEGSKDVWYAEDNAFRYPIHDGWYFTIAGTADFETYPSSGGNYTANVYNEQDELLLTGPFNPTMNLSILQLAEGNFLLSTGYYLYLYADGVLKQLLTNCKNLRLSKMRKLNSWKQEGGN